MASARGLVKKAKTPSLTASIIVNLKESVAVEGGEGEKKERKRRNNTDNENQDKCKYVYIYSTNLYAYTFI